MFLKQFFQMFGLPLEVIEMVLMKAVIGLHARHRVHLLPRADVVSVVTVSSVCLGWCAVVSGSRRCRREMREFLRNSKVIFPF
jgi:hypothetical protein